MKGFPSLPGSVHSFAILRQCVAFHLRGIADVLFTVPFMFNWAWRTPMDPFHIPRGSWRIEIKKITQKIPVAVQEP